MGNISETEALLAKANHRLKAAISALAPKHKGGEIGEFQAAQQEVLRRERELAEMKSEPYAAPFEFPVKWDVGAPLPFVLLNERKAFLVFHVSARDNSWDGSRVKMIDPASKERASLCLVTFDRCVSAKMGHPNDEAQRGHFLSGRGLEGYSAQIVRRSPWLAEVAKTNSVHSNDDPKSWAAINHYVFWFHDSTFECLARSYEVHLSSETMSDVLDRVQIMLLK